MRFIVTSLICLLLFAIGCAEKQAKNPDQVRAPIEDKQSITSDHSTRNGGQSETSTGDEQKHLPVNPDVDNAGKHFMAFMSLSATDPEAARSEFLNMLRFASGSTHLPRNGRNSAIAFLVITKEPSEICNILRNGISRCLRMLCLKSGLKPIPNCFKAYRIP